MHKAILKISVQVRHAVIHAFIHRHPTQVFHVPNSWLIHIEWAHEEPGAETGKCAAARRSCCLVTAPQHPTQGLLVPGPLTLLRAQPAPLHAPGHSQWWPAYGPPAAGQTQNTYTMGLPSSEYGVCGGWRGGQGPDSAPGSSCLQIRWSSLLWTGGEATLHQECPCRGDHLLTKIQNGQLWGGRHIWSLTQVKPV